MQSLRDALDHVALEKRALIGQLALEREGVAHTEDSLRQCESNNTELENVRLCSLSCRGLVFQNSLSRLSYVQT